MVYLIKQSGAAAWTVITNKANGNANDLDALWNSHHCHHVVQFNSASVTASTPPVQMSTVNNGSASGSTAPLTDLLL